MATPPRPPLPPAPTRTAAAQRTRRRRAGEEQREAERTAWSGLPVARSELLLPILQIIADKGSAAPADLYEEIREMLRLDPSIREEVGTSGTRTHRLFDRSLRWAMQDCKRQGWLFSEGRAAWRVTEAGNEALGRVRPGVQILVFRTAQGQAFAAVARESAALIEPESVQALFTSPLFPLCSGIKSYGTMTPADWLPWMIDLVAEWIPLMREDGCLAFHLGSAVYYRGMPTISSYRERFVLAAQDQLGLYRMPEVFWEQPARLPNLQWGAVRGFHPRPTVDPIYIFSRSAFPYMAAGEMRDERTTPVKPGGGPTKRPSGLEFGPGSFAGTRTRFPSALIRAGNAGGREAWRQRLKAEGLPAHPCPMPIPVARTALQMMTRPGDLAFDPFFGSGATGAAAETLGLRWIGLDHHGVLLEGASLRPEFEHAQGYERCVRTNRVPAAPPRLRGNAASEVNTQHILL